MVDLGPNIYPKWGKGAVPSAEEWQYLFSQKLDNDRLVGELANALSGALSSDVSSIVSSLTSSITTAITPNIIAAVSGDSNIVKNPALKSSLSAFISGASGLPTGGSAGVSIWSDANGQPQYTDATNGTRALMLQSASTSTSTSPPTSTPTSTSSASSSGYRLLNKQVWATGGNYTYTPTAGTTHIIVKLCGAGGGGGGCNSGTSTISAGGGGSGGTYAETNLLSVPTGTTAVAVGSGGAGGASGNNPGSNGGVSSFGTIVTCPGGIGGAGGLGETITTNIGFYTPLTLSPGPAAGSITISVIGGYASAGWMSGSKYGQGVIGCAGGSSFLGPGAPALVWSYASLTQTPLYYTNTGFNGSSPGSGGSGAAKYGTATSTTSGGNGADGIVIIEEYC